MADAEAAAETHPGRPTPESTKAKRLDRPLPNDATPEAGDTEPVTGSRWCEPD